ncbi:MAG TPA: hypothetical protein PLN63_06625 [Paludibacteraceae bacterium]|jgi:hypothetical protein|nr:hypothetical protein [Paludibacteraceae bacterium]
MNENSEIIASEIIVIQSLSVTDYKTGESLYNDILRYKNIKDKTVFSSFFDVFDKKEFKTVLDSLVHNMKDGHVVTLHLETHGCDDGIGLASGEVILWKEFFECIRPINEKMFNLLLVVMSMCKGAAISSLLEPQKRAPYRAFVGFENNMKVCTLLDAFNDFYDSYNNILDLPFAFKQMNDSLDENEKAWCLRSSDVFDLVLNPNSINEDIVDKYYNIEKNNFASKEDFKNHICDYFKNSSMKYRNYYNFKD